MNKKELNRKLLIELKNNTIEECLEDCNFGLTCKHNSLGKMFTNMDLDIYTDKYIRYYDIYVISPPFSIIILLLENNLI